MTKKMTKSVQVVLAPTEAKRLLSKAVLQLEEVKKALKDGIIIIHPSSTTIFILEELGFSLSDGGIWICGHVSPKGLCISRKMLDTVFETPGGYTADKYPFELVIRKGEKVPFDQSALGPVLEEMTANDVYIKSVNAIDPENNAGILMAAKSGGGSIGLVLKKQKEKKFKMIIPVGLEKRIPTPIGAAIKAANQADQAQGIPCGLWRLRGEMITEIEAFRQLFDVEATPISAGGVKGAEGCIIWVLTGEESNVDKAFEVCNQIRGVDMPYELNVYDCDVCKNILCTQSDMTLEQLTEQLGGKLDVQH